VPVNLFEENFSEKINDDPFINDIPLLPVKNKMEYDFTTTAQTIHKMLMTKLLGKS